MNKDFTTIQIEAITKVIEALYNGNTKIGTIVRNENIQLFKDNENNCYISFDSAKQGELAGVEVRTHYMKINALGERTNLSEQHDDFYLQKLFSELELIIF